ncbi:MAG: hypothetical protein U0Y08_11875 [Bacteroidia bacterium]
MKQLLIFLLFLTSCSQPSKINADEGIGVTIDSLKLNSDSLTLPADVIDQIIKHYNDTSNTMKADNTDSTVSVVWFYTSELEGEEGIMDTNTDTSWNYQLGDSNVVNSGEVEFQSDYPSDVGGISQTVDFSKFIHDQVKGDINNDGIDDLIVTVMVTSGGSAAWDEIFIFIFQEGRYILNGMSRCPDICGCSTGTFKPIKIANGQIVGTSTCWTPEDAQCCPSLEYNTTVTFDGKGLKFVSKVKVK